MVESRTTIQNQNPSPWSNIHFFITFIPGALGLPNAHCPFPSVTRGHMTLMKWRHFKPSKNSFSSQISKDNSKQLRQRVIGSLLARQPGWNRRLLAQEEPTMSSSGLEKTREYALTPPSPPCTRSAWRTWLELQKANFLPFLLKNGGRRMIWPLRCPRRQRRNFWNCPKWLWWENN